MVLIAPNVVRCALEGTYLDAPMVNIVDVRKPSSWSVMGPDESARTAAEAVAKAWEEEILPLMKNQYSIRRLSYTDLSSANGATGELTNGGGDTWPLVGAIGGAAYSGAVATLVTKATESRRGQRSGRMFLAPTGEADIDGNMIGIPYLAALNGALGRFLDAIPEYGPFIGDGCRMVVVHTPRNLPVAVSEVTSLVARARVSTQRRRNR